MSDTDDHERFGELVEYLAENELVAEGWAANILKIHVFQSNSLANFEV
jgi:hypothetical protein